MTVHFIGAGPGAPDLITLRGRDLLARCPVCLYAGSIVPRALLDYCPDGARIVDTAKLSLDEIEDECVAAHAAGEDVARLQSGDLAVYSALAELAEKVGGSRGLCERILASNTAAETVSHAEAEKIALGDEVARAGWETAAAVVAGQPVEVEIAVFDRDGRLVGHAPFRAAHAVPPRKRR